jgi:hypothetical protein
MRDGLIGLGLALAFVIGCGSNVKATDDAPIEDAPATNCGSASCNGATQFCYDVAVGRLAEAVMTGCNTLPTACGSTPSCACVTTNETFSCPQTPSCNVTNGVVTVVCGEP